MSATSRIQSISRTYRPAAVRTRTRVVTDPNDKANIYIYISGSAGVRSSSELAGCSALTPDKDKNSSLFRIEIIKVPLAHPEQSAVVNGARIFEGLMNPARHGEPAADVAAAQARAAAAGRAGGGGGRGAAPAPGTAAGPTQCHDITVYPQIGLAGGACGGYGLLLDIGAMLANPEAHGAAADSNFSFWHSATFNNDGTKILFSDEWGGGTQLRCRTTDKLGMGRGRDLLDRCGQEDDVHELATRCQRRRRSRRTASPTTAR